MTNTNEHIKKAIEEWNKANSKKDNTSTIYLYAMYRHLEKVKLEPEDVGIDPEELKKVKRRKHIRKGLADLEDFFEEKCYSLEKLELLLPFSEELRTKRRISNDEWKEHFQNVIVEQLYSLWYENLDNLSKITSLDYQKLDFSEEDWNNNWSANSLKKHFFEKWNKISQSFDAEREAVHHVMKFRYIDYSIFGISCQEWKQLFNKESDIKIALKMLKKIEQRSDYYDRCMVDLLWNLQHFLKAANITLKEVVMHEHDWIAFLENAADLSIDGYEGSNKDIKERSKESVNRPLAKHLNKIYKQAL